MSDLPQFPDSNDLRTEAVTFLMNFLAPGDLRYTLARMPKVEDDPTKAEFTRYFFFLQHLQLLNDPTYVAELTPKEAQLLRQAAARYNYQTTLLSRYLAPAPA